MKKSPVVHFEMPYENASRVSDFYKKAFGWEMQPQPAEYGGYVVAVTTEVDEKSQRPKEPGAINGGFYPKEKSANPYPSFVIGVEDINQTLLSIKKAGGTVISEAAEIPQLGMWAVFIDTEGNKVSVLQPSMKATS